MEKQKGKRLLTREEIELVNGGMIACNVEGLQSLSDLYTPKSSKDDRRTRNITGELFKDQLHLSQESQGFTQMLSKLNNMDTACAEKAANLEAGISAGTYDVDSLNIASRNLK